MNLNSTLEASGKDRVLDSLAPGDQYAYELENSGKVLKNTMSPRIQGSIKSLANPARVAACSCKFWIFVQRLPLFVQTHGERKAAKAKSKAVTYSGFEQQLTTGLPRGTAALLLDIQLGLVGAAAA